MRSGTRTIGMTTHPVAVKPRARALLRRAFGRAVLPRIALASSLALVVTACRPTTRQLCTHIMELNGRVADDGTLEPAYLKGCEKNIKNHRLDAGALRWGKVTRCVLAAPSREAVDACWVGQKPPDDP